MEGNSNNSSILNEDSLIQILLWLPVISLLRFKSVCNSWRAIIENPFFIHTHATTTTTTSPSPSPSPLLLRGKLFFTVSAAAADNEEEEEEFEEVYFDTPGPDFEEEASASASEEEEEEDLDWRIMVGCCNGIICFHGMRTIMDHYPPKYYQWSIISLWNPAIKQYRFLQIPFALQPNLEDPFEHFAGFGFDVKTKDYKLFLITHQGGDDNGSIYLYARHVHVYSLSTDSWRCIDSTDAQPNLSKHRDYLNQGHYLNGSYIFLAGGYLYDDGDVDEFQQETTTNSGQQQKCFKHLIMSFDFTQEIFRTIQLPFVLEPRNTNSADPILFGEKIAVLHSNLWCNRDYIDIWVLNEYGGNESWSKFYNFVSYAPTYAQPIFITDNGQFILLDTGISGNYVKKLQLLNVVTGEIKDLQCDWKPSDRYCVTRVGVYKPSLISIVGNGTTDHCPLV